MKIQLLLQFSRLHVRLENGPLVSGPLRGPCMAFLILVDEFLVIR